MAKIKIIEYEESTGRLKEIYDEIIKKRGKLAEVHKIQSLRPESIVKHMDLYLEIMFSKSELSRAEREMMAVITSVCNTCKYCQTHHAEALLHYWKDENRIKQFIQDFRSVGLNTRELALCEFASVITKNPDYPDAVGILRKEGLSDAAILDATLVVAYFNFVNRIVLTLGVETNEIEKTGYVY
ncbi:MAG: alkyl hydroperoxide reductase AhpD [Bacteroidia bacterium]|nr:MAG: alkyl hydroperoxide reductase AhpD [Bacteroidia bacterium]